MRRRRHGRSIRREDYIAPAGTGTKVPVLPVKQDKPPRPATQSTGYPPDLHLA